MEVKITDETLLQIEQDFGREVDESLVQKWIAIKASGLDLEDQFRLERLGKQKGNIEKNLFDMLKRQGMNDQEVTSFIVSINDLILISTQIVLIGNNYEVRN